MALTFYQLYFQALIWNFTVPVLQPPLIRYPAWLVPNNVSQLNSPLKCSCSSVTSEKKWSPDKSCSDIAVLIFASIRALLEPTVSFCTATIKITGQWNIPPEGRGWRVWKKKNRLCSRVLFLFPQVLFYCIVLQWHKCWDTILWETNLKAGIWSDSYSVAAWGGLLSHAVPITWT